MIDRTRTGIRCHTVRLLRTVNGNLPRGSQGSVVSETENLGRHLILVKWDNGFSVPVFPEEIEIDEPQLAAAA
jgi:hypothetical protein